MKLVLVRHGQTDSNLAGALDTAAPGADLNETGRKQARALVGKYFELVGVEPDAIFASNLVRTQQTVEPLTRYLGREAQIFEEVREVQAGSLEMRTDEDAVSQYLGAVVQWVGGNMDVALGGAETGKGVLTRFTKAINLMEDQVGPHGVGLICAHGAVLRLICHWLAPRDITLELIAARPLANTGIALLNGSMDKGWRARLWNDRPVDEWDLRDAPATLLPSKSFLEKEARQNR